MRAGRREGRVDGLRVRLAGALGLWGVAITHLTAVEHKLTEAPYMGVMFIGLIVASVVLSGALLLGIATRAAWASAGGLAGSAVIGYVLTRSVALPQIEDHVGQWLDPAGLAAILFEVILVGLAAYALTAVRPRLVLAPAAAFLIAGYAAMAAFADPELAGHAHGQGAHLHGEGHEHGDGHVHGKEHHQGKGHEHRDGHEHGHGDERAHRHGHHRRNGAKSNHAHGRGHEHGSRSDVRGRGRARGHRDHAHGHGGHGHGGHHHGGAAHQGAGSHHGGAGHHHRGAGHHHGGGGGHSGARHHAGGHVHGGRPGHGDGHRRGRPGHGHGHGHGGHHHGGRRSPSTGSDGAGDTGGGDYTPPRGNDGPSGGGTYTPAGPGDAATGPPLPSEGSPYPLPDVAPVAASAASRPGASSQRPRKEEEP